MTAEQHAEPGHIIGRPFPGPLLTTPVDQAYAALKELENSGQLTFPEPQDTVVVGTIDLYAGTFSWAVPTVVQTITQPPSTPPRNNTTSLTVGVIATTAVDLLLSFNVPPAVTGFNSRVTITGSGFPTVAAADDQIVLDAGLAASAALIPGDPGADPAVSSFNLTISITGKPDIQVFLFILRPPVLGIGAFTIEALPTGVIYAPPQESGNQNFATFSQSRSVSRSITAAITNGSATRATPAYTAADLIFNAASAIRAVAAVVGTGGAGGIDGVSVVGTLSELGTALTGGVLAASDATVSANQQLTSGLEMVRNILSGLSDSPQITSQDSLTVESDHSMTLMHMEPTPYETTPGEGPGIGDRISYLYNVRVIWMVVNGEIGINVLGAYTTLTDGANSLTAERQNLESGGQPTLSPPLSLDGITSVLAADVMVDIPPPVVSTGTLNEASPPRVAAPRFLPANPPAAGGTDAPPDTIPVTVALTSDNQQVTVTTEQTISDLKPGWDALILGAGTDTTTTATLTTTQTADVNANDTTTSTLTMFGAYNIVLFTDTLYSSYAALDPDSPLLQGPPVTIIGGSA